MNKRLKRLRIHPTARPVIYIARKLDEKGSSIAWKILSTTEFKRSERVDEVILLRGGLKEGEKYKVVARSPLQ